MYGGAFILELLIYIDTGAGESKRSFALTSPLDVPNDDISTPVSRDQLITQRKKQTHFLLVTMVTHHHLYGEQTGSEIHKITHQTSETKN